MRHKYQILSFVLIGCLCCWHFSLLAQDYAYSLTLPVKHYSQDKLMSLKSVLNNLEEKHKIRFNYASELVDEKDILIDTDRLPEDLDESLGKILQPLQLRYEKINDRIIGIYPIETALPSREKSKSKPDARPDENFVYDKLLEKLNRKALAYAQSVAKNISGTVKDENNEPLPGVNVVVKNTTVGTVTDIDGKYRLSIADDAQVLVFSSVGYTTEEVTIGNQTVIDLTMVPDVQSLSEVVVVGYGTQKKSDLTGAVSSVEPEEITRISERRLETALQGRAAGVQVTRGEGKPGTGAKIDIRGAGSIGNNEPLWIVDGVPQDPGNYFNMNDVESIEILKDASASAIYGARAAHGVILVTTKRGASGEVKVNFSSSIGQRSPVNLPDMLDTFGFVEASSQTRINAGQTPESAWSNPESLPNTNWVDEIYGGDGLEQSYNLSISGGNEKSNFFVSGAYDRENGIMIDNYFQRYAFRANADFKIGKRIKIGESLLVSRTQEDPTQGDDLITIFRAIPIMPVRDPSNPFGGWGTAPAYFQGPNPVAVQLQNHALNTNNRVNGNVYAEIEFIDGLTLRGSAGANVSAARNEVFREAFNYGALANPNNSLTHQSDNYESLNTNLVLTYAKNIGKHDFLVLGGYEQFRADGVDFAATAQEFPIAYSRSFALATGAVDINERNTISDLYRLESLFGRINYTFDSKYLFSANVRRDGSSRFGPKNQYGVFPSVSLGWRIIEEDFMQGVSFLSDLKIRASYGVLGSDRIGDYIFSRTYRNNRSTYVFNPTGQSGGDKVRGFYLRRFPNEEVKWEEVRQTDIGVDASFLEGKFNLTADYYIKNTTDMLIGVQLPPSFGVSQSRGNPESPEVNIGEVENRGFELSLNYRETVGDWRFDISGNASWNSNEVKQLNEDDLLFNGGGGSLGGGIAITEAGYPIGTYYGYEVEGIFQSQAAIDALNESAPEGTFYQDQATAPGDLYYRDLDGDGRITPEDRTYIGNPWPRMMYGLNVNVNFKNFDFTVFFQGVQGMEIFNITKAYYRTVFSDYNTSERVFESWTAENPTNNPRLIFNDPNGNFRKPSSYFVEDGSFLKMRNIQLGYSLPQALIGNIGLSNARVFVNAQNILTITNYEGIDPELGSGENTNRGFDGLGQYPQTKLISAGVQIGF